MDQLAYDLQLPEEGYDWVEAHDSLIRDIAASLAIRSFENVDRTVKIYRSLEGYPELSGQRIFEWLDDYADPLEPSDRMRIMAQDILNGANLRLHAMDCATNYVEYLLEDV